MSERASDVSERPSRGHEPEHERIAEMLAIRELASERFFAERGDALADTCRLLAARFAQGGMLIAIGATPDARSDARHVAVEFVHPVIVGKRALPALALTGEAGTLREQVELLASAEDAVIAFGAGRDGGAAASAIAAARARGCLTIGFAPVGADCELRVPTEDPQIEQELAESAYHMLWELVHVFLEGAAPAAPRRDPGAAGFLYPSLTGARQPLEPLLEEVRASVASKANEISELRAQTLGENALELAAAARTMRESCERGARLLALGNGGSATDAMDLVADLRSPPGEGMRAAAIDLSEDPAILTATANDVGVEAIFSRQVIAYGRPGDVLVALSTSGDSTNVLAALAEARKRGLHTVALVGYGGGRVAAQALADHVIVTRSEHVPRIQEAQASALHVMLALAGAQSRLPRAIRRRSIVSS